ncbi:LEA type 2 family protein [Salinirubellus sp. GCM10025818]|uniref:LEA type 2 family protein n=1 Tax=Salinirubellus TaxID=2162630 RepID=UPI0030CD3D28
MSRDRSGNRRALGRATTALVVLAVVIAAVGTAALLGVVGAPAVVGVENRFGEVANETTEIETDLVVNNPNPAGVALGGTTVDYTVRMNDVAMAAGTKEGLSIERGNSTLGFTTRMRNERIPAWWVTHVGNDENTTVTVDATVTASTLGNRSVSLTQEEQVETDLIGAFESEETRPVNADRALVSDPVLYVNRTTAAWGNVTDARTPIRTSFLVYNPKTIPYVVTEIGYTIAMNDIVVGRGSSDHEYVIEGRTTENVTATTAIENGRLDEWWVSHLRNDQVTELRMEFYAKIELPDGAEIRVPLDALTYERTVETDIFGTKESDDSTDAGSAGNETTTTTATPGVAGAPGDTDAGTPASGPSTATSTPTERAPSPSETEGDGGLLSGTPTPTPGDGAGGTPTPTDDGGFLSVTRPAYEMVT